MKAIWKHIICSLCALIIIAYMVFGVIMGQRNTPVTVCPKLQIDILDMDERLYLTTDELIDQLWLANLHPVKKPLAAISTQAIENMTLRHPMVRTAECYKTCDGVVHIDLTQRVPLLRVVTQDGQYYIDTDRKKMPVRPSITTPVLIATGNVGPRMAANELSDFAEWLQESDYWHQRIGFVKVANPKSIQIIQRDSAATILLGEISNYQPKLNKLQKWYQHIQGVDIQTYQQLDVRYKGQVIGIKGNTKS